MPPFTMNKVAAVFSIVRSFASRASKNKKQKRPIVYTDGSCRCQGLPNAQAGYGVYWRENHPNNRSGPVPGCQCCHRSEIYAVEQAMQTAVDQKYPRVTIRTDSAFVLHVFANLPNYKSLMTINCDLYKSINEIRTKLDVKIEYVKGHSGVHGNMQADRIAKEGAKRSEDLAANAQVIPSHSGIYGNEEADRIVKRGEDRA